MPSFLELPGEIRNTIYENVLISSKSFTVKLQFSPDFTALFRVNKQIHNETTLLFYQENIFRFPQALFDGVSILEKLQFFIRLPVWRLTVIKRFIIHIPVYAAIDNAKLQSDIMDNATTLAHYLHQFGSPGLAMEVDFAVAEFCPDHRLQAMDYGFVMHPWVWLRERVLAQGGQFKITLRVHPQILNNCLTMLDFDYENAWQLIVEMHRAPWPQFQVRSPRLLRLLLSREGIGEYRLGHKYEEVWDHEEIAYKLSPRPKQPLRIVGETHEGK